jgi:membrane fusion protein (multidrug efflux system)
MNAESPCPAAVSTDDPPVPETARSPRFGRLLFIVLVLAAAGLATGYLPRAKARAATVQESKELSVLSVTVIKPAPAKAAAPLTLSGELKPRAEAAIYARANGYVKKWNVDLGAKVTEGQVLAELETPELDHQLAQARAEYNQTVAAQALAATTATRYSHLLSSHGVSAQEAEEKQADVKLKTAAVEASKANVERLENLTSFGRITAPFAGTITSRRLDVGQLVTAASGQELFHVAQLERLRVFVRVPQSYSRSVTEKQTAILTLTETPGVTFEARVVRTSGAIDPSSRTLLTELEVDNAKGTLMSGSYAQVRLTDARTDAAITVPSNALLFRAEGPQVGIVHADGKVELRAVQPGRDFGAVTEILGGVSAEDQVILNPADSLVNGMTVRISAPAARPAAG